MNKNIRVGLLLVVTFLFFSCVQDDQHTGNGIVRLKLTTNSELDPVLTRSSEEFIPQADDFSIAFSQEGEAIAYWDRFSDFPGEYNLPQGAYVLSATYGDIEKEGFDLPYFEGQQSFAVVKREATEVEVTCSLANVKVTTEYTENFRNYFTAYETQIQSVSGNTITFSDSEERAAYVKPGRLSVYVKVTRSGGEPVTMQVAVIPEVLARQHYKLKLDVDAGSALLNVSFSDETERVPIQIDISDEALNAPAPFFTSNGFQSGVELSAVEGNPVKGVSELSAMLNAQGGISKVLLFTQSKALLALGWPAEVDLLDTDDATLLLMQELGLKLKGLDTNIDKIAVVDFTEVVSNLQIVDGDDQAVFKLVAIDKYSRVTETETILEIKSLDNGLKIGEPDAVNYGAPTVQVEVQLDGDPDRLKFQYYSYGVWHDAFSCRTLASEGNSHQVEVTFEPELTLDTEIRAVYVRKPSNEVGLAVGSYYFTIDVSAPGDVWATKAYIRLVCEEEETKAYLKRRNLQIQYCKVGNEGTWITPEQELNGDLFTVFFPEDAEKENTYLLRALSMDGTKVIAAANTCEITTERAIQIPNSDLETWSSTSLGSNNNRWFLNEDKDESIPGWCSLNAITTQNNSSSLYKSLSGTRRTTTQNSGSYAAEIVTVGWGPNNDQPISSNSTRIDNITPGELFLGTINENKEPVYGYPISSRPLGLSFYYSFTGKGTPFTVSVRVTNEDEGVVLAENTFSDSSTLSAYTLKTLALDYKVQYLDLEATHIYVIFSSGENTYNQMDRAYNAYIVRRNENTGNKLYIDDIKLEY